MELPERLSSLPEYAFPRLRALLESHAPGGDVIHMSLGEPKHPFPVWLTDVIVQNAAGFNSYPANPGSDALRDAIATWFDRRYGVPLDANRQIIALNGTREGLFNAGMALLPEGKNGQRPVVLLPNPFYQVYMVAALCAGADPVLVPATAETGHLPDYTALPAEVLNRTVAAYICSPANPQGVVATPDYWADLIRLAETYDFRLFADECYSEIYRDDPPPGAMPAAVAAHADPERVLVFHSLSKRSNLPGLRSGFAAGGPRTIAEMTKLRSYAGAPLPPPLQAAAAAVWADEAHVIENRALYAEKYQMADAIFDGVPGYMSPQAGFFLWLPVQDGEAATLKLWQQTGVRVLPGAYLARGEGTDNPGRNFIRAAMVAPKHETERGLTALRDCLYG